MGYFTNYPKHIVCILGNEFCERFCFYGMRAVLVIYLWQAIGLSQTTATSIYHAFLVLTYFLPIVGAIIADSWLGKCKTVIYVSIIYVLGNVVMTVTAIPLNGGYYLWGAVIGLILIAIGTGGIKPCVSSFGGDQFSDDQVRQKESFFSFFYMAINIGSLLSTILTPMIRGDIYCFNSNCYALAFAIPAILMIVAIVLFIIGSRWAIKVPPSSSVILRMFRCIGKALVRKFSCRKKSLEEKKNHWLEYAEPDYDHQFVSDVKAVTNVIWIFLPLPVFWALYDQQGSTWTLQATQMDGMAGSFLIQPDLVQALNPLLIIILVPLIESLLFPCLDRLRVPFRPLQRMGVGMLLAVGSFIIAAGIQSAIDKEVASPVGMGQTKVQFINTSPCDIEISVNNSVFERNTLTKLGSTDYLYMSSGSVTLKVDWSKCPNGQPKTFDLNFKEQLAYDVFLCDDFKVYQFEQEKVIQTDNLKSSVRFFNALEIPVTINLTTTKNQENEPRTFGRTMSRNVSKYDDIILADFYLDVNFTDSFQRLSTEIYSRNGAVYTAILYDRNKLDNTTSTGYDGSLSVDVHQMTNVKPWATSILLQIPQYVVISIGECFFSITGLAFAYTQAPPSMKSFLSAMWLLTDSIGNIIVIIIDLSGSSLKQIYSFILFACLMLVTTVIFGIMCCFYEYVDQRNGPAEELSEKDAEQKCDATSSSPASAAGNDGFYAGPTLGLKGIDVDCEDFLNVRL